MEEFLKLAPKMIEYNHEHFNHNVELLLPETGKVNRVVVLHRFNNFAEIEELEKKQEADVTLKEMGKEILALYNDITVTMYRTL